jgi:prevent-host-death family protein
MNINLNLAQAAGLAMKTVSMVHFRHHAEEIIAQVQKGQRLLLTRRGKPVARLEPILPSTPSEDDPFYSLGELADTSGIPLSNRQIDDILYGP